MNFTRKDFDLNEDYMHRIQKEAQHAQLVQSIPAANINLPFTFIEALDVCQRIRQDRMAKWYMPAAWQCRVCVAQAKAGIPARLAYYPQVCRCPAVAARLQLAFQPG
jgi:hypothetical protein